MSTIGVIRSGKAEILLQIRNQTARGFRSVRSDVNRLARDLAKAGLSFESRIPGAFGGGQFARRLRVARVQVDRLARRMSAAALSAEKLFTGTNSAGLARNLLRARIGLNAFTRSAVGVGLGVAANLAAAGLAARALGGNIAKSVRSGLRQAQADITRFSRRLALVGAGLTTGGVALGGFFAKAASEFARVEQVIGRFQAIFGELSDDAGQFADTFAKTINQSRFQIRDQLAQFQATLTGAGFDPAIANTLSKNLTAATQDLIALDDTIKTPQDAVRRLLSGLVGETESVRRFGADVRAAQVDQELFRLGIEESSESAEEWQRQFARFNIIMRALGQNGAIGQAAREVNTLAAQMRGLKAAIEDTFFAIGEAIGPAIATLVSQFTSGIRSVEVFAQGNRRLIQVAAATVPVMIGLGVATTVAAGAFAAIATVFGAAGAFGLSGIVVPILSITGALAVMTTATLLVARNFDTLKAQASSAAASINSELKPLRGTIEGTIGAFADALTAGDLELAAQVGLTGLELAWEQSIGRIRDLYNLFIDEVARSLIRLQNVSPQTFTALTGEKVSLDPEKRKQDIESALAIIDSDAEQRQLEIRTRQEDLKAELNKLKADAESKRADVEAQRDAEQKAARIVAAQAEAAAKKEESKFKVRESTGTFSTLSLDQIFGPQTDHLKSIAAETKQSNITQKSILETLQDSPLLRYQ